ncbi:MAG: hypothetical protein D6722_21215 [Bacteroidetes bacterium]|nr:MAG: hypothetical protein D6722_21215 [Bacteroidota bacterium]
MSTFLLSLPLAAQQIREIAMPGLPDVAMATYDQFGPVIYYNPQIMRQVPPALARFFRLHEHGHHALNHIRREYFDANPYNRAWVRQQYEKEADCFAARRLTPLERRQVIAFFVNMQGPNRPDWYHPTGYERAMVIENCR